MIPPDLEPAVRRILASLRPGETLTTAALRMRLDPSGDLRLSPQLVKLADNVPGLCTRGDEIARSGYMKGKRVRPCMWHHIPSPDMPCGTVQLAGIRDTRARLAGSAPIAQSSGAASPGTSLADRMLRVEDWIAGRDPLFRVL